MDRRTILQAALAPVLLPLLGGHALAAVQPLSDVSPIRIIQTKDPRTIVDQVSAPGFAQALGSAVLGFLQDNYSSGNLPVWKKPLSQIDLQSRLPEIARYVVQGIIRHASIHPVDPCWIMAQMMAESFFYEFAVSSALAVGPCQFIAPTAQGYGLICADAHTLPPGSVRRPDLEPEFAKAARLRDQVRTLRRDHTDLFNSPAKLLRSVLQANAGGQVMPDASTHLATLQRMEGLQSQYNAARDNARTFLTENFQGRSIFNPADVVFFEQFEQRVLYPYSINAMVKMMAENLRARGGNILAATAGYNAGLGNTTYPAGVYTTYGRIPNFSETVDYVSKIVINHHEILQRI